MSSYRLEWNLLVENISHICKLFRFTGNFLQWLFLHFAWSKSSKSWWLKITIYCQCLKYLIIFKILSLWADTLLPAVLPQLERFFERVFWNGVQRTRRILLNCVIVFKSLPFQNFLIGGTTKSHTEPRQGSRVVAEQQECHDLPKYLDGMCCVCWCIVVM